MPPKEAIPKERIESLEKLIGDPLPEIKEPLMTVVGNLLRIVEDLQVQLNVKTAFIENVQRETKEQISSLSGATAVPSQGIREQIQELREALHRERELRESDTLLLRQALRNTSTPESRKLKVPEPQPFQGKRNAKHLENFLFDMEQYFEAAKIADADKVSITSMYLSDDAKLWWRTRVNDTMSSGRPPVETWEDLKKELKDQFLPGNTAWVAREAIRRLKQTGSIREYIKEFTSLMLDIPSMGEEDKLFNFITGLQPWAQVELRRRGVKDLPAAIAAADALVELRGDKQEEPAKKAHGKDKKYKSDKLKGRVSHQSSLEEKDRSEFEKGAGEETSRKDSKKDRGCFICGKPHLARDCPKKEKLNALMQEADSSDEEEPLRAAPLQLLGALSAEKRSSETGLIYVDVELEGKTVVALVDSGATHSFLSDRIAKQFELQVRYLDTRVKPVNSRSQQVAGIARHVKTKIGAWEGSVNFTIISIDDFDAILGIDFFVKASAVLTPHMKGMLIHDPKQPCFIQGYSRWERREAVTTERSSAMRLTCGQVQRQLTNPANGDSAGATGQDKSEAAQVVGGDNEESPVVRDSTSEFGRGPSEDVQAVEGRLKFQGGTCSAVLGTESFQGGMTAQGKVKFHGGMGSDESRKVRVYFGSVPTWASASSSGGGLLQP